MDCDKYRHLLVEMEEGTIGAEDRKRVELHLTTCDRCKEDLALIGEAFATLRNVQTEDAPTHYFTNLLPRIRQRIDEGAGRMPGLVVPAWLTRVLAQVSAAGVVAFIVMLYVLLGPATDSMQTHLQQIVSQLPKEEIEGMAESTTYSPILTKALEPPQKLSESISNFVQVSRRIERELADDEVDHGHRMSILLAADNSFEDINDDNVDSIINKLNDTSL